MGAGTRQQIASLAERNEEADWFPAVCADIANGDSVDLAFAKLTNEYAVSWGAFRTWIRADAAREKAYQDALEARAELRREKAAHRVTRIAVVDHADGDVSVGDSLKAATMILGTEVSVKHSGTVNVEIVRFADTPISGGAISEGAGGVSGKGLPAPKDVSDAVPVQVLRSEIPAI